MRHVDKSGKAIVLASLFLSVAVNLLILPLSIYIGNLPTNPPTDTTSGFMLRFLLVQFLPLLWLGISICHWRKGLKAERNPIL
ncbi:hypothetical protein DRW41_21330 [Neobacillus piezotolerans]|uniref:Uncharacterized protein n=1 Tax=Neobacillus piezotolerans TaxID=2259171 RepID=A0A3D8GKK0_9BACI|nr:hypothetical protein DRW41_21330 [Neobacillus piezotolerans]